LDELFNENLQHEQEEDDGSLFDSDDETHQHVFAPTTNNKHLLDENASLIPGSPFSKPSDESSAGSWPPHFDTIQQDGSSHNCHDDA
jgi:hypothetical protein